MRYIRVQWNHKFPDEPVEIFSELDDAGWEIRKIEVFPDGSLGSASRMETNGPTVLGDEPVPSLDEIAADQQFKPARISREEFEGIWSRRFTPITTTDRFPLDQRSRGQR